MSRVPKGGAQKAAVVSVLAPSRRSRSVHSKPPKGYMGTSFVWGRTWFSSRAGSSLKCCLRRDKYGFGVRELGRLATSLPDVKCVSAQKHPAVPRRSLQGSGATLPPAIPCGPSTNPRQGASKPKPTARSPKAPFFGALARPVLIRKSMHQLHNWRH